MMFRADFWVVLPCKMKWVDNNFTRQYNPEDSSEHFTLVFTLSCIFSLSVSDILFFSKISYFFFSECKVIKYALQ
jgi:hypothetical protein